MKYFQEIEISISKLRNYEVIEKTFAFELQKKHEELLLRDPNMSIILHVILYCLVCILSFNVNNCDTVGLVPLWILKMS